MSGSPVPGLTFRSSSRSSSPCAGASVCSPDSRQELYSPRADRTQPLQAGNVLFGSTPSQSVTKPGMRYPPISCSCDSHVRQALIFLLDLALAAAIIHL